MVSKKLITSLATSAALASVGFATVGQVVPQLGSQVQTTQAATSAINNYINNNNIQPVSIQYRAGTFNKMFGYENGVGKPEGVVIHETATPGASAENEVSYFSWSWKTTQTYVHAFVDDKEIINIHSADYGVWGAGQTANSKYIQVELCRVNTTDQFARSVANQAYYAAFRLVQYGLPFTPGKTVLSHNDVSRMYRETTHTDPVGYFAQWGYSMDQFYDLVGKYYNQLKGSSTNNNNNNNNNANTNNGNNTSKGIIRVKDGSKPYVVLYSLDSTNNTMSRITNRALGTGTDWQTDQTKDINGVKYYRVATNEWVPENTVGQVIKALA
ncbi:peptidoglycan recognition protein family protein [Companilactobacillus sp. HBUAS56275]|uniref:peptidoglycan recognition protein family protein n=1 Tax=Companilactobacillus sp. HBUAS56275 TaxID=3109364 RepID=UPI002FF13789